MHLLLHDPNPFTIPSKGMSYNQPKTSSVRTLAMEKYCRKGSSLKLPYWQMATLTMHIVLLVIYITFYCNLCNLTRFQARKAKAKEEASAHLPQQTQVL